MKRAGKILKYLCFLAILTAGLFKTNEIMAPKFTYANSNWPSTATISGFYDMKPDTVDVLFLGSSHAFEDINTGMLWDEHGMASFILSGSMQPMELWFVYNFEMIL